MACLSCRTRSALSKKLLGMTMITRYAKAIPVGCITTDSLMESIDATHYALKTVNKHIERRLSKLQANTTRLKRELWLLQRHIKEFRHPLFENWEADMLTRLIEVAHAHQYRKLPGGVVLGQSSFAERENLTHAFSIAAKGIRQNTLQKLGLSEKYHQALQRYSEVSHCCAHLD